VNRMNTIGSVYHKREEREKLTLGPLFIVDVVRPWRPRKSFSKKPLGAE
jgi:hypothetical protein